MSAIKMANITLAFLLELCMLGALGYWGFTTGGDTIMKITLGIGAPLLAAAVWGIFLAPKAAVKVGEPWHLLLKIAVFGAAVAALFAAGQPGLGWALAIVFVINTVLIYVWNQ